MESFEPVDPQRKKLQDACDLWNAMVGQGHAGWAKLCYLDGDNVTDKIAFVDGVYYVKGEAEDPIAEQVNAGLSSMGFERAKPKGEAVTHAERIADAVQMLAHAQACTTSGISRGPHPATARKKLVEAIGPIIGRIEALEGKFAGTTACFSLEGDAEHQDHIQAILEADATVMNDGHCPDYEVKE